MSLLASGSIFTACTLMLPKFKHLQGTSSSAGGEHVGFSAAGMHRALLRERVPKARARELTAGWCSRVPGHSTGTRGQPGGRDGACILGKRDPAAV